MPRINRRGKIVIGLRTEIILNDMVEPSGTFLIKNCETKGPWETPGSAEEKSARPNRGPSVLTRSWLAWDTNVDEPYARNGMSRQSAAQYSGQIAGH